jgi:NAD(P)H-hydrate repair Nnr-like enzyme with NAD(P)H-hydrate dehydratase domain
VAEAEPLTSAWLKAHPLPPPADDADKNARGRVLAIAADRTAAARGADAFDAACWAVWLHG